MARLRPSFPTQQQRREEATSYTVLGVAFDPLLDLAGVLREVLPWGEGRPGARGWQPRSPLGCRRSIRGKR